MIYNFGAKNKTSLVMSLFSLLFLMHSAAYGSDLISGKHLSTSGKKIVIHLTVKRPAPASLIIEQFLGPGNTIVNTSPKAKKVNSGNGSIKCKWLLRNISPGNHTITTMLRTPLKGTVSSVVRFRDPSSGQFIEKRIAP